MDRTIAPKTTLAKELNITLPERFVLKNGIEVYWIKAVKDEAIKIEIVWEAGSKYQNKPLISTLTNRLLLSGTKNKSSFQISDEIDSLGGYYQQSIDKDHAEISLFGLNDTIIPIFKLFADAYLNPIFSEEELAKELSISKKSFQIDMEKGKVLCHRKFNQLIFGSHSPYGQVAALDDYENVNQDDLLKFYENYYRNGRPTIFIVGEMNTLLMEELTEFSLAHRGFKQKLPEIKIQQETGMVHEEKDSAIQTALRIGRILFDKKHDDYYGFQVLNTILGGYFGSRLMANIREEKGYTYGIGSGVAVLEQVGYFFISTEVGKAVKDDAINEILNELVRLQNEDILNDELVKVKNYLLGDFLRQSDGPMAMMECFKNIFFNDLSMNYYNDFIQAIHKITARDLKRIAQTYLKKEDLLVVSVG